MSFWKCCYRVFVLVERLKNPGLLKIGPRKTCAATSPGALRREKGAYCRSTQDGDGATADLHSHRQWAFLGYTATKW